MFHKFLVDNKDFIDFKTLYQIFQSHGQIDECIRFADNVGHYETVIIHYVNNKKDIKKALDRLMKIKNIEEKFRLMYRYAGVFLKHEPLETINVLKTEDFKRIDFSKLSNSFTDMDTHDDGLIEYILRFIRKYCPEQ